MKHKRFLLGLVLPIALAACGSPQLGKLSVQPAAPNYALQATSPLAIKATGGGHVLKQGKKVTFGFTAQADDQAPGKGNIQVTDHATNTSFHGRVTEVECAGNAAILRGVLTRPGGGTFTAVVTDNGEPGRADSFTFTTNFGYSVSGNLEGGNIQVEGFCSPVCHQCTTSGAGTLSFGPQQTGTFNFSLTGTEGSLATGTLQVTATNPEGTFIINSTTAIVVRCSTENNRDTVIITGTGTLSRPDGTTQTGAFSLFVQDAAGPTPSGGSISFDFRNENFSFNFDNSSNLIGGFVVDSVDLCDNP